MNETRTSAPRLSRLSALLLALLLLLFGSGCATISILTEVMRDEAGDHADVTVLLQVDPEVAVAANLNQEGFSEAPVGLLPHWSYEGNAETYGMAFRRHYDTLDDLSDLPTELANLADDFRLELMQAITVTAVQNPLNGWDYFYDAVIVVPQPGEEGTEERGCNPDSQTLGEYIACAVDYNIDGDPELQAALENAGPPVFTVDVVLPGIVNVMQIDGETAGQKMDEGRVQWLLDALHPATLALHAVSVSVPGENSGEALLDQALSNDIGFQGLMGAMNLGEEREGAAISRAKALTNNLKSRLPQDLPIEVTSQILSPFLRANVLANLTYANGRPLFPIFRAAAPIITRMALNAGTNEDARIAVGRLVEMLITLEVERIEEESAQ